MEPVVKLRDDVFKAIDELRKDLEKKLENFKTRVFGNGEIGMDEQLRSHDNDIVNLVLSQAKMKKFQEKGCPVHTIVKQINDTKLIIKTVGLFVGILFVVLIILSVFNNWQFHSIVKEIKESLPLP